MHQYLGLQLPIFLFWIPDYLFIKSCFDSSFLYFDFLDYYYGDLNEFIAYILSINCVKLKFVTFFGDSNGSSPVPPYFADCENKGCFSYTLFFLDIVR